ncbi:Gx transporter family protein, partial [Eubacterium aggregans]
QRLSLMAISVAGAIAHNLGQLIVATLVIGNLKLLLYYLPFLVLLAIPTGLVVGMAAQLLIGALKHQGLLP